jgi:hypothetical protein
MDAIVDAMTRHSMVLFNESFSGTNEREGSEIGRQVVQALLERDASVFFVTHQYDLAEGFRRSRSPTTRFLRAERAPDGRPSYRLVPADPLPTSFAVDVYRRIGGFAGASPRALLTDRGEEEGPVSGDRAANGVEGGARTSEPKACAGPEGGQP